LKNSIFTTNLSQSSKTTAPPAWIGYAAPLPTFVSRCQISMIVKRAFGIRAAAPVVPTRPFSAARR